MCGIVGIAGEITTDLKKVFMQMLIVDQLRGDHSTGVLSVKNTDNQTKITKVLGGPHNLDDSKSFNDQWTDYNKVLLGHNRYATSGKVTTRNSHPFDFDNVVGVHNGSLRNYTRLQGYGKYNVDSEVLYESINNIGLADSLAKVTGAYALVYWDKLTDQMVFIRNGERTLFLAFTDNHKSLLWASEAWMIEAICARNNVKTQEIWMLKPDTEFRVTVPTIKEELKEVFVKQDVKGGTEVVATTVVPFCQSTQSSTATTGGSTNSGTAGNVQSVNDIGKTITETTTTAQETVETHESPISTKTVEFYCGMKGCDSFGAKFVHMYRHGDTRRYRLYLKRADYGQFDAGDIVESSVTGMKVEGTEIVYKLSNVGAMNMTKLRAIRSNSSEKKVEVIEVDGGEDLSEQTEDTGEMFANEQGKYMTKGDFLKKYQFCSYCTGNIEPENGYRFIKGEILCDPCSSNKVLVDSLT